jgi:hypothetical protein
VVQARAEIALRCLAGPIAANGQHLAGDLGKIQLVLERRDDVR